MLRGNTDRYVLTGEQPARTSGITSWLLLEDNGEAMTATHHSVPYDARAVAADLHSRRHPNAKFVTSLLTGQRQMS